MSMDSQHSQRDGIRTGYIEIFGILIVVAFVGAILAGLITHSIGDDDVHVYYRIAVPRSCLQLDATFQDIQLGGKITVYNRRSDVLGSGKLEIQSAFSGKCEYVALFSIKRSGDRTYRVGTGDGRRGRLKFTDEDLVSLQQGRTLIVSASLK
jgi:hypothetical protein